METEGIILIKQVELALIHSIKNRDVKAERSVGNQISLVLKDQRNNKRYLTTLLKKTRANYLLKIAVD